MEITFENVRDIIVNTLSCDADQVTLETNLTPVDASDPASEAVQQQVFTLEHGNG